MPEQPQKRKLRFKLLADVAKIALEKFRRGDPDRPTYAQAIELMHIYEEHANPGRHWGGVPKNLLNQKKPKMSYEQLLGEKTDGESTD